MKYMSVQQFWNLPQLPGVNLLAINSQIYVKTLSLKRANNIPKLPGVDYVAKNWALAMMLKALPLVHFWSVLLLKQHMTTSVRKTLKTLVWSAQNRSISSEICPKITSKSAVFLPIAFRPSLPQKCLEIWLFSRDLSEAVNSTCKPRLYSKPFLTKNLMSPSQLGNTNYKLTVLLFSIAEVG